MLGFGRRDRPLVGKLHKLWDISAVTCSIFQGDTNFVHQFGLPRVSMETQTIPADVILPELTDFSRYSMACSWLLKLLLC